MGEDRRRTLAPKSADADIRNPAAMRDVVARFRPDVIINTAAYNFVDRAEVESRLAFEINALAVRELAKVCRESDTVLLHCSSNYVFNGRKRSPYLETDDPDPLSVYALSKLAGEVMARRAWKKHFIVRTSGLYGFARSDQVKTNFVEQMLARSGNQSKVKVVKDQTCTPTNCRDLASALLELAASRKYGLYHVTNAGQCSWAEFAKAIFKFSDKQTRVASVPSTAFPTAAERPLNSVLSNRKFKASGFTPLRPWPEALKDYLREREAGAGTSPRT